VLTLLGNMNQFPQQGKHKAPSTLPLHSLPLLSNIFLVISTVLGACAVTPLRQF